MISDKLLQQKSQQELYCFEITRIVISYDNQSYFIGAKDGSISILNATDLSLKTKYDRYDFDNMQFTVLDI